MEGECLLYLGHHQMMLKITCLSRSRWAGWVPVYPHILNLWGGGIKVKLGRKKKRRAEKRREENNKEKGRGGGKKEKKAGY